MMKKQFYTQLRFSILCMAMFIFPTFPQARILYVDKDAMGLSDGSSWANAFQDLQAAIDVATDGDTIFVAEGKYFPTKRMNGDSSRNASFYINKAISLYGGFTGEQGSEGDLSGRNAANHPVVLSGDIGVPDDTIDNSFHVLYIDHVSDSMLMDGFIIRDGNTFNATGLETIGAGIYNDGQNGRSNPVFVNCRIWDNHATESGGGFMNNAQFGGTCNPLFLHCEFTLNEGSGGGAVTSLSDSEGHASPTFIDCEFKGNTARTAQGAGISCIAHSSTSKPVFINCILTGNHAPNASAFDGFVTGTGQCQPEFINCVFAGNSNGSVRVVDLGMHLSSITVRNSIFWGNGTSHGLTTNGASTDVQYSIMQFGFEGEGNLAEDPQFEETPIAQNTPHTSGDVHLSEGSPAIDAGNNTFVPSAITTDADALPRFIDHTTGEEPGIVDIGPYEVQEAITGTFHLSDDPTVIVYPNPAFNELILTLPFSTEPVRVELYNANGIKVDQKQSAYDRFIHMDLSSFHTGSYFLVVTSGLNSYVRKFIIQH
jgi:hypothetical protein